MPYLLCCTQTFLPPSTLSSSSFAHEAAMAQQYLLSSWGLYVKTNGEETGAPHFYCFITLDQPHHALSGSLAQYEKILAAYFLGHVMCISRSPAYCK